MDTSDHWANRSTEDTSDYRYTGLSLRRFTIKLEHRNSGLSKEFLILQENTVPAIAHFHLIDEVPRFERQNVIGQSTRADETHHSKEFEDSKPIFLKDNLDHNNASLYQDRQFNPTVQNQNRSRVRKKVPVNLSNTWACI